MYSLTIDTSTERGAFALFLDKTVIFSSNLPYGFQTAQSLLPDLKNKLAIHDFKLNNLGFIAVGVGPGSYTGIRIGVTVAKALSFVCNIPLAGVCTLDSFIPSVEGKFAAVIDAKIGGVYMQIGEFRREKNTALTKPSAYTLEEATKELQLCGVERIVTPNKSAIQPKLMFAGVDPAIAFEEAYPSCAMLSQIGLERIKKAKDLKFELMYLRKTQAEIEKLEK